jgi:ParB-like chromosome segregation protein Spo0J
MKHHEYANLFPMLPDSELQALAADIAANGLQTPITTLDDMILDGRNRHRACEIAGVDPTFDEYLGGDPLGFVVSHNLHRRHLTNGQRSMIAARLADLKHGGQGGTFNAPIGALKSEGKTRDEAAAQMKIGRSSLDRAKKIQRDGIPKLVEAVDSGEISVNAAWGVSSLPSDEQAAALASGVEAVKAKGREAREAAKKQGQQEPQASPKPKPARKSAVPSKEEILKDQRRVLGNLKAAWSAAPTSIREEFLAWVEATKISTNA